MELKSGVFLSYALISLFTTIPCSYLLGLTKKSDVQNLTKQRKRLCYANSFKNKVRVTCFENHLEKP